MTREIEFLSVLCRVNHNGGRIIPRPGGVVEVLDVPQWTFTMQQRLETFSPMSRVDIEQCPHSLSGFMIRVRFCEQEIAAYAMMSGLLAALAALTAYCLDLI